MKLTKKSLRTKIHRARIKNTIIKAMGNKCQICGYSKCISALEFHHLNKDEKEGQLAKMKSWEKAYSEAKKCILLCALCHREVHFGATSIPSIYQKFDERIACVERNKKARSGNSKSCNDLREFNKLTQSLNVEKRVNIMRKHDISIEQPDYHNKLARILDVRPQTIKRWVARNLVEIQTLLSE